MTDDILNTTQNPDELRRLAQDLLCQQRQHIHTRRAEKHAMEQRIREPEDALKLAQQWCFGRKSERLPAHLPRQETVFMPETGCTCPDCGSEMRHIRDEVNEVPEYVPAHFVVKRTVRPQYSWPVLRHGAQRCAAAGGYR